MIFKGRSYQICLPRNSADLKDLITQFAKQLDVHLCIPLFILVYLTLWTCVEFILLFVMFDHAIT